MLELQCLACAALERRNLAKSNKSMTNKLAAVVKYDGAVQKDLRFKAIFSKQVDMVLLQKPHESQQKSKRNKNNQHGWMKISMNYHHHRS